MPVEIVLLWAEGQRSGRASGQEEPLAVEMRLGPNEATLLTQILQSNLSNLRSEISKTASYEMRHQLRRDETMMVEFIERLDRAGVTPAGV